MKLGQESIQTMLAGGDLSSKLDSVSMRAVTHLRTLPDCPAALWVIAHIPEQAEDLFVVLFSETEVAHLEVSRVSEDVSVERELLDRYMRRASKQHRQRAAVALDLLRSRINS